MNLNVAGTKQLIVSDSDESVIFEKKHFVYLDNYKVSFSFNELMPIEEFEIIISDKNFLFIKETLFFLSGLVRYKSLDNLNLYIKDTSMHILVFAIGETQPGLYKIFLEGAFHKNSTESLQ